jgi:hypothetical protein
MEEGLVIDGLFDSRGVRGFCGVKQIYRVNHSVIDWRA